MAQIKRTAMGLYLINMNSADRYGGIADDVPGSTDSLGNSTKRTQPCTSKVWVDFENLYKEVGGKRVRYAAKCIPSRSTLSSLSTGGTGHLSRHRIACHRKHGKSAIA